MVTISLGASTVGVHCSESVLIWKSKISEKLSPLGLVSIGEKKIFQLCSMTELYARRIKWILFSRKKYWNWFIYFLFFSKNILVRGSRPGKTVQMTENEVRGLCLKSREIFLQQPILLELEAPLKICGKFVFLSLLEIWREKFNCGCVRSFFVLFLRSKKIRKHHGGKSQIIHKCKREINKID